MSDSKIDKLKEKLFHHEAVVDNDALWASLESHIPQSKKRRVLPFWWLFGLIGLSAFLFYLIKSDDASNGKIELNHSRNGVTINEAILQKTNQALAIENDIIATNKTNSSINKNVKAVNDQPIIRNSRKSINFKRPVKQQTSTELNLETENGLENHELIQKSNLLENQLPTQQGIVISSVFELVSTPVGKLKSILDVLPRVSIKVFERKSVVDFDIIRTKKIKFIKSYWLKPQLIAGLSNADYKSNDVEGDLAKNWNDNISTLPNIGMNLLFGADISQKWSLFTGVEYNRFTSRISLDRNSKTLEKSYGTEKTIIDENGNITSESGDLTTITYENYKGRWHTYNHIISVPIGVEYYLLNQDRINVKLILGANIKLADFQKGSILNESLTIEKFDFKNTYYQVNPISYYLGSEVEYLINERLSIGFGMGLRSNENRILVHDKIITEKLRSLNSTFSLKHNF